ncbi:MAG: alkaline phosphatase family protein [Fibrobacteria bacterium]|nr:alkaline phosphatase family protein [Fibrobacteria bacterium]
MNIFSKNNHAVSGFHFYLIVSVFLPVWCVRDVGASEKLPVPPLVFVLVVDQMRDDYFGKFQKVYSDSGFNRLLKNGVRFTRHFIPYANTETGPGHATILSGRLPSSTAIVRNKWYYQGGDSAIYCEQGGPADKVFYAETQERKGPAQFKGLTVGDMLKKTNSRSKVFALATKDYAAVMLGGKSPDAVYWNERVSHNITTSRYYVDSLPSWVSHWNSTNPVRNSWQTVWSMLLPEVKYKTALMPVGNPYVKDKKWKGSFPHRLTSSSMGYHPMQTERELLFLQSLIQHESVGKDTIPDLVAWSISSTDYMGHQYGMESRELMDVYARIDKVIHKLLNFLNKELGPQNYAFILTSDHGVRKTVKLALARGDKKAVLLNKSKITKNIIHKLRGVYSIPEIKSINADFRLMRIRGNEVYFNRALIDSLGLPYDAIIKSVASLLKETKGIERVYDNRLTVSGDAFSNAYRKSYYQGRSGTLSFAITPHGSFDVVNGMHGYFGEDCQHIPLVAVLPGLNPAMVDRPTEITDLAPTLAALLRVTVETNFDGKVLPELLLKE